MLVVLVVVDPSAMVLRIVVTPPGSFTYISTFLSTVATAGQAVLRSREIGVPSQTETLPAAAIVVAPFLITNEVGCEQAGQTTFPKIAGETE